MISRYNAPLGLKYCFQLGSSSPSSLSSIEPRIVGLAHEIFAQ